MTKNCFKATEKLQQVTVLVLAHNNQYYLERCFQYILSFGLNAIILDSSEKSYPQNNIPKNIKYQHVKADYWNKVYSGVSKVKTQYVALLGVDDFYVPSSLIKACDFLNEHADYVSVAGGLISINQVGYRPEIKYYDECAGSKDVHYSADKLEERLLQPKRYEFPIYYTLQKTQACLSSWLFLRECLKKIPSFAVEKTYHFSELITYLSTLIQGKHANLDMTFWVREAFILSGSGSIQHFNYEKLLAEEPNLYSEVVKIAATVFKLDKAYLFNAITESLKNFSNQESDRYQYPIVLRKTLTSERLTEELSCLQKIIRQHRHEIVTSLEEKYTDLPKFYHKYGKNWPIETKCKLEEQLKSITGKFVIYGAGEHTEALFDIFDFDNRVIAICDSNQLLWGKSFLDIPLISPQDILKYSKTVLISSMNFESEIKQYLNGSFGEQLKVITLYKQHIGSKP